MAYSITETCNGCTSCANVCPTGAASGEKKEQHRIDAAYCIECGACGRICPKGAVLDPFGQKTVMIKRKMWVKPVFDVDKCMACVMCLDVCPIGCIVLGNPTKKDPNAYPEVINMRACVSCGFCHDACPADAITMEMPATEA